MRSALCAAMLGAVPPTLLASVETPDPVIVIVGALLGSGGAFGAIRFWLSLRSKNEERDDVARAAERDLRAERERRHDERLARILETQREEREKDREKERDERDRREERFNATIRETSNLHRETTHEVVVNLRALTDEVRGLREDQRGGAGCRFGEPSVDQETGRVYVAKPISKPGGLRGG